jgi:hypothetical protein
MDHWVKISPDANGTVSGHAGMDHQDGRDIIPPFEYEDGEETLMFPGQNWDAEGQAIYYNDCEMLPPPPPPNPVVDVTVVQCLVPDGDVPSTVTITITNLVEGLEYTLVVTGPDGFMSETPVVPVDGSAIIEQPVPGPGDYVATVTGTWWTMEAPDEVARVIEGEWEEHSVTGMQAFTVNDCPAPPPPASVTPSLPITSSPPPIKALAVTGAAADGPDVGTALLLLLGAGAALLATGARRGVRSRL